MPSESVSESGAAIAGRPSCGLRLAHRLRLERAGAWTDRERADAAYLRSRRAEEIRSRWLPEARVRREMDRANREREAREARRRELWIRLDRLYAQRLQAIAQRVQTEARIRPAGKSLESRRRYRRQMEEALGADGEYRGLCLRREAAESRSDRRSRRLGSEYLAAGVLAVDTRATRKAKVAAWRESRAGSEVAGE